MNQETRTVDCFHHDLHADVVFNNPARHNAMSLSMWASLRDIIKGLAADKQVRAVVLSGAGNKAFVSGADISEFDSNRSNADAAARYNQISESAELALREFPKPSVAKISGYCIGGGLGIALGCDIRICSDDSTFAIPAAKLGLGYNFANTSQLLRILGQARASELFYTAKRLTAEEALSLGLVNQVVPAAQLDAVVEEMVNRITNNAPLTLAAFKAAAIAWAHHDRQVELSDVTPLIEACFISEDYAEGRLAFKEKRKPLFKGY